MNIHDHNTVSDADQIRAELEDRLMDQNLEELLGGVSPNPEQRTVASAPLTATETNSTSHSLQSSKSRGSWVKPVALLATCAGIALVLFSGIFGPADNDSRHLAVLNSTESSPSDEYSTDDIQFFGTGPESALSRQRELLAQFHREQDETMREIHGLTSTPDSHSITTSQASRSYVDSRDVSNSDPNEAHSQPLLQSEIRRKEPDIPLALRTNSRTQAGALPGDSQLASPAPGYHYDQKSGQPAQTQPIEPKMWKARVLSGRQETVKEFIVMDSKSERYGRTPVLDPVAQARGAYPFYPNPQVPLGWRKAKLEWNDGSWGLDYDVDSNGVVDGAEGVGPGNRGDNYAPIIENDFLGVVDSPLSTFSIDVDTASYSNMRRMLTQNNMLPPPDAVRIEEMVNYFNYDYPEPQGEDPFSVNVETASCPWRPESRLVRIALKGKEIPFDERPASNLVFLLDVSGSMKSDNKLPLLKSCFKMMVDYLTENDSIAIVVYASGTRMVLPPTTGDQKAVIMEALDQLQAGGSTNGAGGIQLAYQTATENFIPGGINRVILATDGDFNVGITSQGDLHRLIEEKAKSNVFLTTLGFGFGNLQDNTIELLADKGNGNYAYIDSLAEGRKVLIDEMGSTLNTIAKDVKIQIEFNPLEVAAFRLIGYENRILADRDFNDDTKDAGEIGAGHTVTAFYEIVPAGDDVQVVENEVDELEFQRPLKSTKLAKKGDMMVVKLRYKQPTEDTSKLLKILYKDTGNEFSAASNDFQFAASVASFGMLLRNSKYAGQASYKNVLEQAQATLGESPESYRVEFVELVKLADRLAGQQAGPGKP